MPRTLRCKLTETHWHHPLVNLTEHSPCHQMESPASMRNPSFLIPASRACPVRLGKQIGQLRQHCCCNWKEDGPLLWEYFTWAWLYDMYLMYILLTIYLKSPSPLFLTPGSAALVPGVTLQTWTLGEVLTLARRGNRLWHLAGWAVIVITVAWCRYGKLNRSVFKIAFGKVKVRHTLESV